MHSVTGENYLYGLFPAASRARGRLDRVHTEANRAPQTVFARVFYAASQAIQEVLGEPQPPWDELPAWQQDVMVDVTRRCMVGRAPAKSFRSS